MDVPVAERLTALLELADADGFDAAVGRYGFLAPDDCCATGASCYGNNPASPYGYAHLPPGAGQTAADAGTELDGAHAYFHLRADEAVVTIGTTPPPVRYFGYRSHLALRPVVGGPPRTVLGTLGPDHTILDVIAARGTLDVDRRPLAVVTTGDARVEAAVDALLVEAGFAPPEILHDRIGAPLVTFGLGPDADLFAQIHRVAVFADPADEAAYRADPGLVPVRLTPRAWDHAPAPHPVEPLPERGSGTDEARWAAAVDAVEAAAVARFPTFAPTIDPMTSKGVITYACLETDAVCGDLSSRIFLRTPSVPLPLDGSFLVAYGPNHQRTGKATYSSVALQAFDHNVGLSAVESDAMAGSARWLLPDEPASWVDDLYAIVIARDCAAFAGATCLEVPLGCPGVDADGLLYVMARLYVDPLTGAAPLESELVADRAILFRPAGSEVR
ncbi:MAG: hypothetical protein ABMB14_35265 [Myxococcota bacterium]